MSRGVLEIERLGVARVVDPARRHGLEAGAAVARHGHRDRGLGGQAAAVRHGVLEEVGAEGAGVRRVVDRVVGRAGAGGVERRRAVGRIGDRADGQGVGRRRVAGWVAVVLQHVDVDRLVLQRRRGVGEGDRRQVAAAAAGVALGVGHLQLEVGERHVIEAETGQGGGSVGAVGDVDQRSLAGQRAAGIERGRGPRALERRRVADARAVPAGLPGRDAGAAGGGAGNGVGGAAGRDDRGARLGRVVEIDHADVGTVVRHGGRRLGVERRVERQRRGAAQADDRRLGAVALAVQRDRGLKVGRGGRRAAADAGIAGEGAEDLPALEVGLEAPGLRRRRHEAALGVGDRVVEGPGLREDLVGGDLDLDVDRLVEDERAARREVDRRAGLAAGRQAGGDRNRQPPG